MALIRAKRVFFNQAFFIVEDLCHRQRECTAMGCAERDERPPSGAHHLHITGWRHVDSCALRVRHTLRRKGHL